MVVKNSMVVCAIFLSAAFIGCHVEERPKAPSAENHKEANVEPREKEILPPPVTDSLLVPPPPIVAEISTLPKPIFPLPIYVGSSGGGRHHRGHCGDGHRSGLEECDDGNNISFDGCSAKCNQEVLLSVARNDDQLRVIDPLTGATLCERTITLTNFNINGANGLATDPTTGELWAVLKQGNNLGTRELVTIDPLTGVATSIGIPAATGLAGLAFDSSGVLYGVTGDGGTPPETLFTLNKTNASATLFLTLGNGSDGETIAYNTNDKFMYHGSGRFAGPFVFEKINLTNKTVNDIYEDTTSEELAALTYWANENVFLAADIDSELWRFLPNGQRSAVGEMDHSAKGLAFTSAENGCVVP